MQNDTVLNVGTTGFSTVFFRMQMPTFTSTGSQQALNNFATRDTTVGDSYPNNRTQISIGNSLPATTTPRISARNDGTDTQILDPASANTWYYTWVVMNASNQTYDIYVNTTGATASAGDLIADDFGWRNDTNSGSINFILGTADNNTASVGALVDDIYYDLNAQNLVNPIPEPSTLAFLLGGIGSLVLLRRFRQRK